MNNAAKAKLLSTEVTRKGREPGLLTAFAAIGVMLSVTAILVLMIYGLMLAIRPIEARQPSLGDSNPFPVHSESSIRQS